MLLKKLTLLTLVLFLIVCTGCGLTNSNKESEFILYQNKSGVTKLSYIDSNPIREKIKLPSGYAPVWLDKDKNLICIGGSKKIEIETTMDSSVMDSFNSVAIFDLTNTEEMAQKRW